MQPSLQHHYTTNPNLIMNPHSLSKMFSLLPLVLLFPLCPASPLSPEAANAGAASVNPATNGKPASEGTTSFDGQSLAAIAPAPAAAAVMGSSASISQTGWTVTVDSAQSGNPGTNAIDGSTTTFWHTEFSPVLAALPHQIIVDMKSNYLVGSITYLPRQDGSSNGNIGEHVISLRYVPTPTICETYDPTLIAPLV